MTKNRRSSTSEARRNFLASGLSLPFLSLSSAGCVAASNAPAAAAEGQANSELTCEDTSTLSGGYVEVEGGRLWYADSGGDGVPILLLHAFTGSAESWICQYPAFVHAGFRVIALSGRGTFRSEAPLGNPADIVSDILSLLDRLNLAAVHLVGTAAGGMRALRFAMAHPERIRSLVMSCTLGGLSEPSYIKRQRALLTPEFLSMPIEFKELGPSYRYADPDGVARWLEIARLSESETQKSLPEDAVQAYRRQLVETGPDYTDLATIAFPVLLIYGGADLYSPPSLGRVLAAHIPHAELSVIGEAGHSAFWEKPSEFNTLVLEFLGRQK